MRCSTLLLWAAAAVPIAAAAQTLPEPSAALVAALAAVRAADPGQMRALTPAPAVLAALAPPDRDALVYWLESHGRGALHAQGLTDEQIGVPYFPLDYRIVPAPLPVDITPLAIPTPPSPAPSATPAPHRRTHFGLLGGLLPALRIPIASSSSSSSSTSTSQTGDATQVNQTFSNSGASVSIGGNPWGAVGALIDASVERHANRAPAPTVPWRDLPFATSALSATDSPIEVARGFAAVRTDGTEGVACLSFVNGSAKIATEVDFDIEILNELDLITRVQALRRTGMFAPGAEIGGPSGPRSIDDARANCVIDGENSLADPTDPFANAGGVAYAVRRVAYADGTAWLQAGANPWPP